MPYLDLKFKRAKLLASPIVIPNSLPDFVIQAGIRNLTLLCHPERSRGIPFFSGS